MGQVTFVRHGQASLGAKNYDQLSELGGRQSQVLGQYLEKQGVQFDHVVCGSLQRHHQTLAGIVQGWNCELDTITDPNLDEFAFMSVIKAYLNKEKQPAPDKNTPKKVYFQLLKLAMMSWQAEELDDTEVGESWQGFCSRVNLGVSNILKANKKHTLVVTSGGVIGAMLMHALECSGKAAVELNLQIRNASATTLYTGDNALMLAEFNKVAHFENHPEPLITYA